MHPSRIWLACAAACTLLALMSAPRPAEAHGRSVSYSRWEIETGSVRVRARISLLELTRLGIQPSTPPELTARYLSDHLRLTAAGVHCPPEQLPRARGAREGWAAFSWTVRCPESDDLAVESQILLKVAPSHLHFARVSFAGGRFTERVLTEAEPSWPLPMPGDNAAASEKQGTGTSLLEYLVLGVEHILSGWDHLAFLLALLLLAGTLGEVATLVTSFTVAHSVTLGLAALGVLHPNASAVEAMIGFSIALVAAENSWLLGGKDRRVPMVVGVGTLLFAGIALGGFVKVSPLAFVGLALFSICHFGLLRTASHPARLRAAVAFAFGLVHGFGFAGVLDEMQLDSSRLLPALFGFNAGVEVGQLALVALVWPLLRLLARQRDGHWHRQLAKIGSAAICGLGIFWFVTRIFG